MTQIEFTWKKETDAVSAQGRFDTEELVCAADAALRLLPVDAPNANTRKAYRSAIRYFGAWYALRFGSNLTEPFATDVVLRFLRDHLGQSADTADAAIDDFSLQPRRTYDLPKAIEDQLINAGFKRTQGCVGEAKLRTMLAALIRGRRESSRFPKRPDPNYFSRDDLVSRTEFRKLLDARSPPEHSSQTRHTRLTPDLFASLVATCNETPRGLRDRALLHFGWNGGGLNSQEIASANIADFHDDGLAIHYSCKFAAPGTWGIRVPGLTRTYSSAAADAIRKWIAYLASVGIHEGALWRSFHQNHAIRGCMAPACIREIVREHARKAGLAPHQFSARSLNERDVESSLSGIPWVSGSVEHRRRLVPYSTFRALIKRRRFET